MKIYRGFDDPALKRRDRSAAIGIFDGVHLGHQQILKKLVADAKRARRASLVITFDPHPAKVLHPAAQHPPILMSLAHRLRLFEKLGVTETLVVRFDRKFSGIAHETFVSELLVGRCGVRSLTVGYDFRFGHQGLGTLEYLSRAAKSFGFRLSVVGALKQGGRVISSTEIRRRIVRGQLKDAARMLGRPVSVYGDVVKGKGRGKKLGFPTANINPHHETLPPSGVYAVRGFLGGRRLAGVLHLGARPTFAERDRSVEVHFFNLHSDLYGREIELEFIHKLRNIKHFKGPEQLIRAIESDIRRAKSLVF